MFSYQMVQIYLEQMFQSLDFARTAMFEAVQQSNAQKDAIVEAKLSDAQKHIKEVNVKLEEMKVEIQRIKNKINESKG